MKNIHVTVFLLIFGLTGCVTIPGYVSVSSTTHATSSLKEQSKIAIMPMDDQQRNSLEFASVAQSVSKKLTLAGYQIANTADLADYVVSISYGADDGRGYTSSVPIYGSSGGGLSTTTGSFTTLNRGGVTFSATTSTMPNYGIVGNRTVSRVKYTRNFNLDIYEHRPVLKKVMEIRTTSSGSCGNVFSVMNQLIEGTFDNFQSNYGKPRKSMHLWTEGC